MLNIHTAVTETASRKPTAPTAPTAPVNVSQAQGSRKSAGPGVHDLGMTLGKLGAEKYVPDDGTRAIGAACFSSASSGNRPLLREAVVVTSAALSSTVVFGRQRQQRP